MASNVEHADSSSYRAAGFSNRMGWGQKPALILIDVCAAYFTPASPLDTSSNPAAASAPGKILQLLSTARRSKAPIIWTQVRYSAPDFSDAGLFYQKAPVISVFHENDTRGYAAYLPNLEPVRSEREHLIIKTHPSAFFNTSLASILRDAGVDTVVICGVSTSGCVRATTLDAMCLDFRPMIVGEACGDRSVAVHESNLFDMDAKMGDVVSVDEAIEHLAKG